jgi:hypothetical protein
MAPPLPVRDFTVALVLATSGHAIQNRYGFDN